MKNREAESIFLFNAFFILVPEWLSEVYKTVGFP